MNRRLKSVFKFYFDLRVSLGMQPWYHDAYPCKRHLIPRYHRVSFLDPDYPRGILLCSKGHRDYFSGEIIAL